MRVDRTTLDLLFAVGDMRERHGWSCRCDRCKAGGDFVRAAGRFAETRKAIEQILEQENVPRTERPSSELTDRSTDEALHRTMRERS